MDETKNNMTRQPIEISFLKTLRALLKGEKDVGIHVFDTNGNYLKMAKVLLTNIGHFTLILKDFIFF